MPHSRRALHLLSGQHVSAIAANLMRAMLVMHAGVCVNVRVRL